MELKKFYESIDGDYVNILERFPSEKFVLKFVLRFPEDAVYELLCDSLDKKDYREAFRAAHTLKGICLNLSFNVLFESSSELCEALRDTNAIDEDRVSELFEIVKKDYEHTVKVINELQNLS